VSYVCQKDYYDKRVHGRPFAVGDLVLLYFVVVPQRKSKKLHHPWMGPFSSAQSLTVTTTRKAGWDKRVLVVQFNSLKLCASGTRFGVEVPNPVEGESPPLSQGDN